MKKTVLAFLLVSSFVMAMPAMAGGYYRSTPSQHYSSQEEKSSAKGFGNWLWDATKFTLKLPFRAVTSTTVGVYDLITDASFQGFKDGYNVIP